MKRRLQIAVSVFFAVLLCFALGLVCRGGASGRPLVLLLLVAALIAVPWFPFATRFSLRTMLIVTTLVAVVLGLGV
jgi:exosortase/archaeosortase